MAERRMFARSIVQKDRFLDMPLSAQALFFHLGLEADDDGFLDNTYRVIRSINASAEDLRALIDNGFVLDVGDGIFVLTHWRICNAIRSDRYKPTIHTRKRALVSLSDGNEYVLSDYPTTIGIPTVDTLTTDGMHRRGKNRGNEDSVNLSCATEHRINEPFHCAKAKKAKSAFIPPTLQDVEKYCEERGNDVDPKRFFDYYAVAEWKDKDGNPVKNWKQKMISVWENAKKSPKAPTTAGEKEPVRSQPAVIDEDIRLMTMRAFGYDES